MSEIVPFNVILPVLIAVIVAVLIPFVAHAARRVGYIDDPGGRKDHDWPTPPVGGIVFVPVALVALGCVEVPWDRLWPLYPAVILMLVTGFVDDRWPVNAKLKFALHFISGFLLVVPTGLILKDLDFLMGPDRFIWGWFAVPFTVACIVYLINAMNMMDGVDGLSSTIMLVMLAAFALAPSLGSADYGMLMVIGAALAGFWVHNMRFPWQLRARVFMGDAGSMAMGVILAWCAIRVSQDPVNALPAISVAWILALPIFDAFGLFFNRLCHKQHPFQPDRNHLHHHFLDSGFTPAQTTLALGVWAALYGAIGLSAVFLNVPEWMLTALWVGGWGAHTALTFRPHSFRRCLRFVHARWCSQAPV